MSHTHRSPPRPRVAELLRASFRLLVLLAVAAIAAAALLIVAALAAEHPNEPIVTLDGQVKRCTPNPSAGQARA